MARICLVSKIFSTEVFISDMRVISHLNFGFSGTGGGEGLDLEEPPPILLGMKDRPLLLVSIKKKAYITELKHTETDCFVNRLEKIFDQLQHCTSW